MDTSDKLVTLHFKTSKDASKEPIIVQLNQSDLFELISAFLAINRSLQGDKSFFED